MGTEVEVTAEGQGLPYPLGSFRDILTALFKHKTKIITVFLIIFAVISGYVFSLETLYSANTSLILKMGREHIIRPEVGQDRSIVKFDDEAAIKSELNILSSRDLIRRVVQDIGYEKLYPEFLDPAVGGKDPEEKAVSEFLSNLYSSHVKGSNVIQISYLNPKPTVAAKALNVLIEHLKEKHLQIFSDPKASFLGKQLKEYREHLENSEDRLQLFNKTHNLSSPIPDQQRRLLDQRTQLDTSFKLIKNQIQGFQSKIISIENQMKVIPKDMALSRTESEGTLAKAKSDLFELRRKEQGLLTRYTAESFPVQNLRKEIELIENFIMEEEKRGDRNNTVTSGKNPTYQKLELDLLEAKSEIETLEASGSAISLQIEDLDRKLQRLDELNNELLILIREKEAAQQNYNLYLNREEEAKVSEEMDRLKMANLSVIQSAEVPRAPATRSKILLTLLGAVFAGMVGVGIGIMAEFFEGTYTRPDQAAQDLNLPLLASFSQKL